MPFITNRCPVCVQQEKIVQRLYQKQGIDRKQSMTGPELREFMEQYVRELEGSGDRVVTDEEALYVLKVADTLRTGEIRVADIMKAVATWQSLLADQEMIDSRFELYDRDSTGTLSRSQVAEILKDLNGGAAVGKDEVEWVVEQADGKAEGELDGQVDHGELRVVLAVWYTMQTDKNRSTPWDKFCCCCRGVVKDDTRSGPTKLVRPSSVCRPELNWACRSAYQLRHALCLAMLNLIAWGVQVFRENEVRKEVKVTTRRDNTGNLEVAMESPKQSEADDTDGP